MTDVGKPEHLPGPAVSRRRFLGRGATAGVAIAGGTLWAGASAVGGGRSSAGDDPIRHIVISMQENRSFDHYYGYAPQVQAAGFGPPAGYTQPDAAGGTHAPFELTPRQSPDPPHHWVAVHSQYNGGKMDGFFTTAQHDNGDGNEALVYYTAREIAFYHSLFDNSGLCANYFCSMLGPTLPNRYYLMAGTSGGLTTNGKWGYGVFDSSGWPIILDLLEAAGVSWKIYYIGFDDVNKGDSDNVAVFWSRWAHDPRTTGTKDDYLKDLADGQLPQVSWIISSATMGYDEHPSADVSVGMRFQEEVITALRRSSALAARRLPAHLRRARRLLRPRRAAADRRLRPRRAGAAVGDLALRAARRDHVGEAGRPRLDAEVHRAHLRPAHPGVAEQPVRPLDADRRRLPHEGRAGTAARRPPGAERPVRPVRLLLMEDPT